jgi:hypothetical protein
MARKLLIPVLSLVASIAIAADEPLATAKVVATTGENRVKTEPATGAAKTDTGAKELSGMSILGNQEAPKALVIVPWKSSQLGDTLGIAKTLDEGRQPVDKDVFMRQLSYYEIRAKSK